MKETPNHKRERFVSNFGLKEADVEFYISNRPYADLFESSAKGLPTPEAYKILSNYIVSDIAGMGEQGLGIAPALLSELVTLIIEGKVSSRGAKNILSLMAESGESPEVIATREGLFQKNDESAIRAIIDEVIKANPLVVEEYKAGKESSIQFLIGQGMRLSKGSANPGLLKQMLEKALK
jgi:aspartyl-tRNA(Asn)/glutamyl-tRNA(Gln) amidotransferase subunit B